jgi:hypothetical protein
MSLAPATIRLTGSDGDKRMMMNVRIVIPKNVGTAWSRRRKTNLFMLERARPSDFGDQGLTHHLLMFH